MKSYWKNVSAAALLGVIAFPVLPINHTEVRAQNVTIDGQNLRSGVAPIKRNGRTLVAMRPIFEGLGASVQWDAVNKRITAETDTTTVVMQIGNPMALVNSRPTPLEQAPLLYLGNTMVPLRFVSESLGAQVSYDAPSNNIGITTAQVASTSNALSDTSTNDTDYQQDYQQTVSSTPRASVNGVSISLAKSLYATNEPITLNFTAPTSLRSNAWAAILPADTAPGNPQIDNSQKLSYRYLGGKTRGTLEFSAPTVPGHYIIRVNQDKTQYSSVGFEVQPTTPDFTPQISIAKEVYVPGEPIEFDFDVFTFYPSGTWVGILPSDIEHGSETINNANRLTYQYLGRKTQGTLTFKAPTKLGSYDFRLNNSYGHEIATIPFSVEATTPEVTPTISVEGTRFEKGDSITVHFTAFPFYSSGAWIAMVPAEIEHGSEDLNNKNKVTYQYSGGKTQGTLTFKAPSKDGVYDFRFNDSYGNEIASTGTFTVGSGSARQLGQGNTGKDVEDQINKAGRIKNKIKDIFN